MADFYSTTLISDMVDSVHASKTEEGNKADEEKNSVNGVANGISTISIKDMSDGEVMRLIKEKELQKQREKYEKSLRKQGLESSTIDHKFWNTQPVPKQSETVLVEDLGPINPNIDVTQVRQEPFNMPAGFEWCSLDINDPNQLQEVYNLLTENYVEDDECNFRFDYSPAFLRWALTPPGFFPELHVGVRATKSRALMGCITAIPADIRICHELKHMVEVNFLCVHKKLRTKRLAPVLIKEITRRVNLLGRWQATYTAGVFLPKPVGKCRYHHRSLNPKKLIEIKFSSLPPRTTLAKHLKDLKLPDRPAHNFQVVTVEDMPKVLELLNQSLTRCKLAQVFSLDELTHILMPRPEVVSTYVHKNSDGVVTDFCSFYHLPSSVIKNDKHKKLNAVYSYYNIATSMTFIELMTDALVLAQHDDADVFNALDLCDNNPIFEPLKFGSGDGYLHYYLYNWKCPFIETSDVGLVLL